ncbi:MAG: hypothetical protein M0R70_11880 [Nitrospirae bacterium]|nr:hypothetical protein [Nitrospirota bacterium]
MKSMRINTPILTLICLLALTLLITGCGRKEAESAGCPSGSFMANATDKITSTGICGWKDYVYAGGWLAANGEGCVQDPVFTVTDINGNQRNNVCIVFSTNGIWWTDHSYTTKITSDQIVRTTNDSGTVTLYWTTYPLPLSSAATSTTEAGKDYTYVAAAISAVSGVVSHMVSADIAVTGCPKETFGPPASCP